ncbi:hypothetical protein [Pseudoxanthomonas sp. PXM04]|uniref:hypothetical protein n=1 Tax=Pseudoxanthomonas sp. PXM04 TaxID=2769297 RepID=UPI001CE075F3|nr:hypothetical protein [Pseudoxanthomonas sp. PXM04]
MNICKQEHRYDERFESLPSTRVGRGAIVAQAVPINWVMTRASAATQDSSWIWIRCPKARRAACAIVIRRRRSSWVSIWARWRREALRTGFD